MNTLSVAPRKTRSNKGQGVLALVSIVGFFVMPLLAVFTFEVARLYLAKQELQNACDAASLAAVATLASSDNTNTTLAHQNSIKAALKIMQSNFVLGSKLTSTKLAGNRDDKAVNIGESKVYFEFRNPITNAVEDISSANAKVVRVYGSLVTTLAFGKFVGINSMSVNAIATGAVPRFDVSICFDISGSMDDQTPISCVKRKWDPTLNGGSISYEVISGNNGVANGKLFDVVKPDVTGSSLNGIAPQLLTESYWNGKMYFTEYLAKAYGVPGLRSLNGYPDAGQPPGNYPPGTAFTWDGYPAFTDMVVNIDGNQTFSSFEYQGYSFPNLNTLIEAARGNLENDAVFKSSKANTSVTVSPRPGYQKAYLDAAANKLQPMNDAKSALLTFNDILNTDADTHFGLVSFDSAVGADPNSTETWYSVDDSSSYGQKQGFPLPHVKVSNAADQNNYDLVNKSIKSCVAMGSTNIGGAIHEAVQDIKNKSRLGSVKAIVLFTDGEPTLPCGPLDTSDPLRNARLAAAEARDAGIAIYTVGLAQNPAIIPQQVAILNDKNSDPSTGGIAAIAGHGGTFTEVTNSADLRSAFSKIARNLVRLIAHEASDV
ncbi:MAG: VWA domain-containing protein [Cyanobacteria bacterium SZAS LIN-5]|nr:VWA domain-containing protein [Cyanobacteria bacterium SZAS LIN-5]